MATVKGARVNPVPEEYTEMFLSDSPGWTRLEPQSVSGDPSPGLAARVHDPAWLLARQWQLGEFRGEDAGSPVSVEVTWATTPVSGWCPPGSPVLPLGPDMALEPTVESELPTEPGLRRRFDAGAQFVAVLTDAGFDPTAMRAACGLLVAPEVGEVPSFDPEADPHDKAAATLVRLLRDRVPDAERIAAALRAPARPAWLPADAHDLARDWLRWYHVDTGANRDCWVRSRLEYAFTVAAGPHELRAEAFGGGRVDWYHFDHDRTTTADSSAEHVAKPVWATPLRFSGMPVDRYWEFEDAEVNLGALEAKPHDLARLALAEFALVYSQDWLVVPVDVPVGALTVIKELAYTTTFGDRIVVPGADERDAYRMFEIDGVPGLLVPPMTPGVLEGQAIEEVRYLRDEAANLGWAVERVVRGPSGDPRTRTDEPRRAPGGPGVEVGAELDYLLESGVPDNWIPLVPTQAGIGAIELRKATMASSTVSPYGVLLRPEPLVLKDEEVPREGVTVRRVPKLTRLPDGGYARWIARRVDVGRGEAASRIAFDSATARPAVP